ncbi:MAG: RNA 2'-phosphotransferase [Pseudomonadota bacterium]
MASVAQSKRLSLILRHAPEEAGLTLGAGGWVAVSDLLEGLARMGAPMTRTELDALVAQSDKKRFTLSEDGTRIRAAQGHSVRIDTGLSPQAPPETLYHGTSEDRVDVILNEGLSPMSRLHVHLSTDPETARIVGKRHGAPVVLKIHAEDMAAAGHPFFLADNGVWLTDAVPRQFLTLEGRR